MVMTGERSEAREIGEAAESVMVALEGMLDQLYTRALMLTQQRDAADDLVQKVCERALRAQDSYQAGTNLAAWLNRLMRNLFIDDYRSQRAFVCLQDEPAAAPAPQPDEWTPHDVLTRSDVLEGISALPPKYQEVLRLAYFEELSYREIADRLGISAKTAGTRLFRGRSRLRRPLQKIYAQRLAELTTQV